MRKPPRKIPTAQSLSNIALHYLGRYAASEASLRRVLENRIRRSAMDNPEFAADAAANQVLREAIDRIVETHKRTGIINDALFAEAKVNSLRRQGRSKLAIQQKLAVKGIRGAVVAEALEQHADGAAPEEVELKAAMALARRRKLGPFRKKEADEDQRRKDFAALARAGFSSNIAKKVLQAEAPEEWE